MEHTPQRGFIYETDFNIGFILSRSFEIIISSPLVFLGLTALATLPSLFLVMARANPYQFSPGAVLLPIVVSVFFGLAIQGAIACGVFKALKGDDVSIIRCLMRGFSRVLSIFLASMAAGLCLGVGFVLLVVPGIIILTMIFVAIPACTVEKMGPVECLNRSAKLTKGNRLKILGLLLIYVGIAFLFELISNLLGGLFSGSPMAWLVVNNLISIIPSTFYSVMVGVAYFDLRVLEEGADLGVGGLADIFE